MSLARAFPCYAFLLALLCAPAAAQEGPRVSLELCVVRSALVCGVDQVRVGETIKVRVTSPVSGRLSLIDENADSLQSSIVPLPGSSALIIVEAGRALDLPPPGEPIEFIVTEPAGNSILRATVLPNDGPRVTGVKPYRVVR
jgi:hypothetical protein